MTTTEPPFDSRYVKVATPEQLARHHDGWRQCEDEEPHSAHQLRYSPWLACPGVAPDA